MEAPRRRIEEDEPGQVDRTGLGGEGGREQRAGQPVDGQQVEPAVAHEGRGLGHRLEHGDHTGPDFVRRTATSCRPRGRAGRASQVVQVLAFGLVQLECAGQRIQDAFGDAAEVAALEAGVVLDTDAGQQRDLLTAQARDPAVTAVQPAEPGLLRAQLRPPAGQELADLAAVVHAFEASAALHTGGIPCQYQLRG
jgi:hypothetical protein